MKFTCLYFSKFTECFCNQNSYNLNSNKINAKEDNLS